jgi:hypothetical protein
MPEEDAKIAKLLRKRGLTWQAFSHAAIMRAFNEATLAKKTDGEVLREDLDNRQNRQGGGQGLGIKDRLVQASERRRERYEEDDPMPSSATPTLASRDLPPVLTRSTDDEVMSLARTIVESPQSARRDVIKAALRVLARGVISRGGTQEESLQLADDLTAAVRRLEAAPQTALERVRARMGR